MSRVALYAHRWGDPSATGIGRYARQVAAGILAGPTGGLRYLLAGSPAEEGGPVPATPVARPPGPRRVLHTVWSATGRPTVDRWIGRPDLVHVLYPSTPVPTRCPRIYTVHDLMPLEHPTWFARYERTAFARAAADAAHHATHLVAVSTVIADQLHDRLGVDPGRVTVVPNGVAPEFFADLDPARVAAVCGRHGLTPGAYVLCLGTVSARKNLDVLAEALATQPVARRIPVVAVGPPGQGAELTRDRVRDLGLGATFRFTGWLPDDEVAALLRGALALVHPSTEEGFGMTPLEAMASGVPVICSREAALPEVVGGVADLVPAGDADAWAAAMERMGADPGWREDLVRRGRERAAGFTWAETARRTVEVHRRVLEGRPR